MVRMKNTEREGSVGDSPKAQHSACTFPSPLNVCVFHFCSFCLEEAFIEATWRGHLAAFPATGGFKMLQMDPNVHCLTSVRILKACSATHTPRRAQRSHSQMERQEPRTCPEHSNLFKFTPRGKQGVGSKTTVNSQSSLAFPDVFHKKKKKKQQKTALLNHAKMLLCLQHELEEE